MTALSATADSAPSHPETLLVWCEAEPPGGEDAVKDLGWDFSDGRCIHLHSIEAFTRWLFEQERGVHVVPSAILVCGLREAKLCAKALLAARTGDASRLRASVKRESTRRTPGRKSEVSGLYNIAVGAIVCVGDDDSQISKLQEWLRSHCRTLPLSRVSSDMQQLLPCLHELEAEMRKTSAASEHVGEPRQPEAKQFVTECIQLAKLGDEAAAGDVSSGKGGGGKTGSLDGPADAGTIDHAAGSR